MGTLSQTMPREWLSVFENEKKKLVFTVCKHTAKNFFSLPCVCTRQRINLCRVQTHGKELMKRRRSIRRLDGHVYSVFTVRPSLPCAFHFLCRVPNITVCFTCYYIVCYSLPCAAHGKELFAVCSKSCTRQRNWHTAANASPVVSQPI